MSAPFHAARGSLAVRLAGILLVAAMAPSAAAIVAGRHWVGDVRSAAEARVASHALDHVESTVRADFRIWGQQAAIAAQNYAIIELLHQGGDPGAASRSVRASLESIRSTAPGAVDAIAVVRLDGFVVASSGDAPAPGVRAPGTAVRLALPVPSGLEPRRGCVVQSAPMTSPWTGRRVVQTTTPIVEDGTVTGALLLHVRIDDLRADLMSGLPAGGDLVVTDADGRTILDSGGGVGPGSTAGVRAARIFRPDVAGGQVWHVTLRVPTGGSVPADVVWEFLGLIAVSLLLAGLATWLLVRGMLRPVRRLTVHAERLAAGRLDQRVPVQSGDELGRLAQALNTATESIESLVARLRSAVRERDVLMWTLQSRLTEDPLTGLGNRRALTQDLADLAGSLPTCLALLDLDGFKAINDARGHGVGDDVLRLIGARLTEQLQPGDRGYRLGGDEFAVLLAGDDETTAAHRMAGLLEALQRPLEVDGVTHRVTASIGVVACSSADPLSFADLAMYAAKKDGKCRVVVYDPTCHDILDQTLLAQDLRRAIDDRQLGLVFQPLVGIGDGQVVGVEALARWTHPTRGAVAPEVFVRVAAEHGLGAHLDNWALDAVMWQMERWISTGTLLQVSMNITAACLLQGDFVDKVVDRLNHYAVPADLLTLEVTEQNVLRDVEGACTKLSVLREAGVRIALDDFGSGYSALSYLQQLPVDVVKLDRSFLRGRDGGRLLDALVGLCHALGLWVVAEGVETERDLGIVTRAGCDAGQGWFWSRAVPPAGVDSWGARTEIGLPSA